MAMSIDSGFIDSSVCSPSSSICTVVDLPTKNVPVLCKICGDPAQGHHFGGYSCHACGAFFRRSVSNQQQYSCARNKTCEVGQGHSRGMCKACRFKRCIAENMRIQAIVVRTTDDMRCFDSAPMLKRIYLAQRGTFVNRYSAHLKYCHGNKDLVLFGVEDPIYKDIERGMFTEYYVLEQFVRESGFIDLGFTPLEIQQLSRALFRSVDFSSIFDHDITEWWPQTSNSLLC
ncbi:CRE-NHR-38 protein [Aphelenchoides bicaudatus]|nr:CRE-NHR-38 protein [Aphelenchoides bicaudatus]